MTFKASDIVNKLVGSGLVVASIGFLSHFVRQPELMFPGLLFGVPGLWLLVRRERASGADVALQGRLEQLTDELASTRADLSAAQERLDRLGEERDFMRQLTSVPMPPPAPRVVPPNSVAERLSAE